MTSAGAAYQGQIPRTSEVPFFSSVHGRQRRALRKIGRRDLQAAVKYGTKEPGWPHPATGARRWKYTHANIVYITDESSTVEVTSYAEPISIPRAPLALDDVGRHDATKHRLRSDPTLSTSHTVIVVDQSGSMKTADVFDFPNRSKAVFAMLALDFVAAQIESGNAADTDIVSVVLMRNLAEIIFEGEPMGLVLYNKFVDLHEAATPSSHGCFAPALDAALELLRSRDHGACALALLFLSDGSPSDHCIHARRPWSLVLTREDVVDDLIDKITNMGHAFGQRLAVTTIGFAKPEQNFLVLESMAEAASHTGAHGEFHRPDQSSGGLGTALAHTVSSLTTAKTRLTTVAGGSRQARELRTVRREAVGTPWGRSCTATQTRDGWIVYTMGVERHEFSHKAQRQVRNPWVTALPFSDEANGIAIRSNALGEGAERLVFGLQEISTEKGEFVGPKLVAKESRYIEEDRKIEFHTNFARTQLKAANLARKFNERVKRNLSILAGGGNARCKTWEISFLPCSVFTFQEEGYGQRSVLAEKMLAGTFTKYNGNNGYVHGAAETFGSAALQAREALAADMMSAVIEEGDNEDEDYDTDSDCAGSTEGPDEVLARENSEKANAAVAGDLPRSGSRAPVAGNGMGEALTLGTFAPGPECYVQAFSHWSYRYTRRKMLVCDLQGVQTPGAADENRAGVFELTDPVIHYKSTSGRLQVYGRTDFGTRGIHKFFSTHECNDVCRLLGLRR